MPRAKRICPKPGCPHPIANRYCPTHDREYEAARGNSNQRGYGIEHQRARANTAPTVAKGRTPCARCGQPILPGQAWHLDHTNDRTSYLGPSHDHCNLTAAGKASHAAD